MKTRTQPKVWAYHAINHKHKPIGYIQLVSYLTGGAKPHIEFFIDKEYRNKGIMTKELVKYLRWQKKYNNQLIAVVKQDNTPSIKLLEKNGFIHIANIDDKRSYIVDLNLTPEIVKKIVRKIQANFTINKEQE